MEIQLNSFSYLPNATISTLHIDSKLESFVLEDTKRDLKIKGITCIPSGRYRVELRTTGTMNEKYKKMFPFHKGMLWIKNVVGFEFVYLHIGNFPKDTLGCLLVSDQYTIGKESVNHSTVNYERIYPIILKAIESGKDVFINVNRLIY